MAEEIKILTQADVAALSAWYHERKISLLKQFELRLEESKFMRSTNKVLKDLDTIRTDIEDKHKLGDAKEKIDAMTEKDLPEALKAFADLMKSNLRAAVVISWSIDALAQMAKRWEAEHKAPIRMVEEGEKKLLTDAEALEEALKVSDGKPLINSVTGEKERQKKVFPLAKKYGAAVLALCLDEKGIPETTEQRVEIAKKIIKEAEKYGISLY